MPPLKSGGAQHVSGGAVGVAGLRVGGYAGLFPPREATLHHHAEFAVRLAVAQRVDARIGRACTVGAGGQEWHEVGAELAHPVDKTVAASVADENVTARAAMGDTPVGRGGVGLVLAATRRGLVIVHIDEIVGPSAKGETLTRAANDPVVAEAAVDDVVGVGRPVGHVVARLTWGRVEAVGRQVHRLDELAGHVDRGLLDLAGRVDEQVQVARGKGAKP